jgi:hypothetical protein
LDGALKPASADGRGLPTVFTSRVATATLALAFASARAA